MSIITMAGLAVKQIVDVIRDKAKIEADKELALRQADIAVATASLTSKAEALEERVKTCDASHVETKQALAKVEEKLNDCKEQHEETNQKLIISANDRTQLSQRVEALESKINGGTTSVIKKGS